MIEIDVQTSEDVMSPIMNIHDDMVMSLNEIAYMLYLLDTGVYGRVLRHQLSAMISPDDLNKVEKITKHLIMLKKNKQPNTLIEAAKVPVIKPSQSIRMSEDK